MDFINVRRCANADFRNRKWNRPGIFTEEMLLNRKSAG
jgi:hypothetical protein